jgi:hypothetical protein
MDLQKNYIMDSKKIKYPNSSDDSVEFALLWVLVTSTI